MLNKEKFYIFAIVIHTDTRRYIKMEAKINVMGAIKALEVNDTIDFSRAEVLVSYVRKAASYVKTDTGKEFRVNLFPETVKVTRTL